MRRARRARRKNIRRAAFGGTAVLVVAGAVLAATLGGSEVAAPKRKPPPPTTTTTTIPIPTAPLTGLPDPDGVSSTRPSLGVKIENTPQARPQTGLDLADVVYEEVVDGGVTRFWAFFNSAAPENVGPVRSVRAMDPQIVTPIGGVIAYSGGTEPNVAAIRATGLVWVDENNAEDAFFREPSRSSPHNLYGRTALLWQRGGVPVPPSPLFQYLDTESGASFAGESIASFHLAYDLGYDVTYVWDGTVGGWSRFQGTDEPFLAPGFPVGVQIAPSNIVVQFTPYARFGEGNMLGSGEAWVFSNGQLVRGTWTRADETTPTVYTDATGAPIALTPGRTWVELLPTGRAVDLVPGQPVPPPTTTVPTTAPGRKGSTTRP